MRSSLFLFPWQPRFSQPRATLLSSPPPGNNDIKPTQPKPTGLLLGKYRCMNQLLFDRSTGSLAPQAFARIQSSQLLHAIQPAPRLLFDGGERELVASTSSAIPTENLDPPATGAEEKSWAHQAGVNALSIDIDGRMYVLVPGCGTYTNSNSLVSGGADSSIKLWGLDQISQGAAHTLRPIGTVAR